MSALRALALVVASAVAVAAVAQLGSGAPQGADDPRATGVVVDETVRAEIDGVDPLGARPERDARHAVPVGLLLQAARVGDDHARLRGERGEVEVPERLRDADVGGK